MKKVFLILLCLSFWGCSTPFVKMSGVSIGDTLYARSNLLVKGDIVYWHNMSVLKEVISVGTEIKVLNFSNTEIVFSIPGRDKKYRILVETGYYDKFFVKNKQDIGLDKISPSVMEEIKKRKVSKGMTKNEALISKGCPSFIDLGEKSLRHPLQDLMDSDTWYYNANARGLECLVKFENNHVSEITRY